MKNPSDLPLGQSEECPRRAGAGGGTRLPGRSSQWLPERRLEPARGVTSRDSKCFAWEGLWALSVTNPTALDPMELANGPIRELRPVVILALRRGAIEPKRLREMATRYGTRATSQLIESALDRDGARA